MADDKVKRCGHCGGTLWLDGDVLKCFMCSRPAAGRGGEENVPADTGRARSSATTRKNPFGPTKWDH